MLHLTYELKECISIILVMKTLAYVSHWSSDGVKKRTVAPVYGN